VNETLKLKKEEAALYIMPIGKFRQ
jgi:hypothetical protein